MNLKQTKARKIEIIEKLKSKEYKLTKKNRWKKFGMAKVLLNCRFK